MATSTRGRLEVVVLLVGLLAGLLIEPPGGNMTKDPEVYKTSEFAPPLFLEPLSIVPRPLLLWSNQNSLLNFLALHPLSNPWPTKQGWVRGCRNCRQNPCSQQTLLNPSS